MHFFTGSDTSITIRHNWKLQKTHNQPDIRFHFFSQRSINVGAVSLREQLGHRA